MRSFLYGYKDMLRTLSEICKFKRQAVFGTIFLSYFESIDPKKLASFKSAHKVPIEEMTDRWETGNSDGWQSMDCSAIRFLHLRGRIPPSKKQQTSEIYKACFDIS